MAHSRSHHGLTTCPSSVAELLAATVARHPERPALRAKGARARIAYHEQQRGQYTNVYLDKIEPAPAGDGDGDDSDPEEAAWRTAVDAAPWLVGESDPHEAVPPDELYDKLKPFKERVADDIRDK